MEDQHHHHHPELELLPSSAASLVKHRSSRNHNISADQGPSLDLQLSSSSYDQCVEALKWQAAEQIRVAALEKAYAERVRELSRREMELAQSEFASARHVWERAREEVEMAERLKEKATRRINDPATCMEITCQSCRQKFRP